MLVAMPVPPSCCKFTKGRDSSAKAYVRGGNYPAEGSFGGAGVSFLYATDMRIDNMTFLWKLKTVGG
jgi:hypothetical protein